MKTSIEPYKVLKSIMETTSPHTGEKFVKIICEELKQLFNANIVFITQAVEINPTHNVKVLYCTLETFAKEFHLDDTPCQLVFDDKIIIIDKDVSLNFKKDAKFKMESFLGLPMHNDQGECFGHLAIMSKQKQAFLQEHIDIAKVFLGRIESEILRHELEKKNQKITQELYTLSITDPLTQLFNRRYFQEKSEKVSNLVKRSICKASMIILDLDDFKKINDNYGHDEGDFVLIKIGEILLQNSRTDIDFISRIGGEEFAIISLNNSHDEIIAYINRLVCLIKDMFQQKPYSVTLSVGISHFNKSDTSWQDTYRLSDERMYLAKSSGKDKLICE